MSVTSKSLRYGWVFDGRTGNSESVTPAHSVPVGLIARNRTDEQTFEGSCYWLRVRLRCIFFWAKQPNDEEYQLRKPLPQTSQ
jgi:hypothetical protein